MRALLFIWQFPQCILALIIRAILFKKIEYTEQYNNVIVYITDTPGFGISLGNYIFLDKRYGSDSLKHEYGHVIQSWIFGPLYLLVIGFASAVCNNWYDNIFHKSWSISKRRKWYYNRFPEKWADKLGLVDRN